MTLTSLGYRYKKTLLQKNQTEKTKQKLGSSDLALLGTEEIRKGQSRRQKSWDWMAELSDGEAAALWKLSLFTIYSWTGRWGYHI